jgi:uncharacterized protein (TIGR02246 family)
MSVDAVRSLYRTLIERWNAQDADGFADCFAEQGTSIGFDGSTATGRASIASHLAEIFADHKTASYVAAVRDVQTVGREVTLLLAVVGMVPPGEDDLNPNANAIQSVVASQGDDGWRIVLFQNTPAASMVDPMKLQRSLMSFARCAARRPPTERTTASPADSTVARQAVVKRIVRPASLRGI